VNLDDVQGLRRRRQRRFALHRHDHGDLRCTDLAHLPAEATSAYDNGPPQVVSGS